MAVGDDLEKLLGPLEAEVMRAVWTNKEPVTPRQVLEHLNEGRAQPLAYTTVMTVMSRLAEKELLGRSPAKRGWAYEALVSDAAGIAVRDVMRDFGAAALAHFVAESRADPKLRRRLEKLLRED
ncbi:MAG: BlaI/MecI/CopY family transcriptional regulator [Actinobacteria bacterium]|nr:MAG: BlaI/MecI/CopY family transcriptional regulator [Actinomycetota bacterium]